MTRLRGIPLDTCEACGEPQFDGRRCSECGSLSLDYLHELVRRDLASRQPIVDLEAKRRDDGRWEVAA
jgi:ribosomal protein L32